MNKMMILGWVLIVLLLFGCTTPPASTTTNITNVVDGTQPVSPIGDTETPVIHTTNLAELFTPWLLATDAENLCVLNGGTFVFQPENVGCYGVGKLDCGTADAVMARTQCEATGATWTCSPTQLTCAYN